MAPPSDRATRPSAQAPAGLGDTASVAGAGNGEPDWFAVAKGLAQAIMFNRSTRREHVVGKDGRVRMGMVDLFACRCIDDAAREFCEMAGLPFGDVETPTEHQALYMSVTGRSWSDWFTERQAIIDGAGPSPERGKVDMKLIAQAIEARSGETETGSTEGESAVATPCAQTDAPTDPTQPKETNP